MDGVPSRFTYPKKDKKKPTPVRYGNAYVLRCGDRFLVQARPDKGLLGGMLGVPTSDWGDKPQNHTTDHSAAPRVNNERRNWEHVGQIKHVFTHFELRLEVFTARVGAAEDGRWSDDVSGLPTVFRKVVEAVLKV